MLSRALNKLVLKRPPPCFGAAVRTVTTTTDKQATFEDYLEKSWPLPNPYVTPEFIRAQFNFTPRDTDVMGVGYPKTGTTWLNLMLYMLSQDGKMPENLDDELGVLGDGWGDNRPVTLSCAFGADPTEETVEAWNKHHRRVYLSHLPYPLITLNGNAKYVVIVRDGRDTLVSSFFFFKELKEGASMAGYSDDWDERTNNFLNGPYGFGSWFDFTKSWFEASKRDPRVLLITYEESLSEHEAVLKMISDHCQFDTSESQLEQIAKALKFKEMKKHEKKIDHNTLGIYKDKDNSNFLRTGRSGGWKKHWSKSHNEQFLEMFHHVFKDDHPWKGMPYEEQFQ